MKFVQWNSATWWGGAEVRMVELCEELRRRGYEVRIVARHPIRLWRTLKERGFLVDGDAPRQGANLLRAILIGLRLRQWRADLLIAHLGRDYVPALFAGKVAGCPVILYRHRSLPLKPITRWLVCRWANLVLAVSRRVAETLLYEDLLPTEKVHVIHLGIDTRRIKESFVESKSLQQIRAALGAERGWFLVSVGNLYPKKGHATLLLAIHRLRRQGEEVVAAIAGEGPDRTRLETLIRDLELQGKVHLLGYREDVPLLLQACDCFALLSEEDAFPGAIIEAMVVGKPIVACEVGGIPELLENYPLAKLVPPKDDVTAAQAILEMLAKKDSPIPPFLGGPAAAHNTGIRHSQGEYIAFLEHDDLFLPNKLATQVTLMDVNRNWGMCYVGAYLLDGQGKVLRALPLPSWTGQKALKHLLNGNFIPSMSSVVVRRVCLEEVGELEESFQIAHDYDLWLRIATSHWQIGSVPYRLLGLRRHDDNWSAQNERLGIEETLQALEKVCTRYPSLQRWVRRHQARCWYRLGRFYARHKDWSSAETCYRRAFSFDPLLWKAGLRWLQAIMRGGMT